MAGNVRNLYLNLFESRKGSALRDEARALDATADAADKAGKKFKGLSLESQRLSVGAAIAAHPGISRVAFTGETTTGQEIMRLAAGNVKKVSLELGGKSPNIVFADADIEGFAATSPYSVFDNCGQD